MAASSRLPRSSHGIFSPFQACRKHLKGGKARAAQSRGVWGHAPQENFENLML